MSIAKNHLHINLDAIRTQLICNYNIVLRQKIYCTVYRTCYKCLIYVHTNMFSNKSEKAMKK